MADRVAYNRNDPKLGYGHASVAQCVYVEASLLTTDLAANRTVALCKMPKGARLVHASLVVTDMDTGASPTLTFRIGDAGNASRISETTTLAQAGGQSNAVNTLSAGYVFPEETEIFWQTAAAAATPAAGTVKLNILYVADAAA